jgi:predicted metal-binding membrane protein
MWGDDARRMPMSALEAVLRRDRIVVVVALAIVTALAWADLVWLANGGWTAWT